jgi:hypothetical protein
MYENKNKIHERCATRNIDKENEYSNELGHLLLKTIGDFFTKNKEMQEMSTCEVLINVIVKVSCKILYKICEQGNHDIDELISALTECMRTVIEAIQKEEGKDNIK